MLVMYPLAAVLAGIAAETPVSKVRPVPRPELS
jgi:hypothetical protein